MFRPDSEVGTAGVIATHWGHPAGVCTNITWPRLGDVQGSVGIQTQAGRRVHVNHGAALLPYIPEGMCLSMWACYTHTKGHTQTLTLYTTHFTLECCDSKSVCLMSVHTPNTEAANTDEKPCEAENKVIWIWKASLSDTHTVQPIIHSYTL